jgi:hypothetical protein
MTIYHGGKSLDAEISINLKTGEMVMDYTLNKVASKYSSNDSAVLKDDFKALTEKQKWIEVAKRLPVTMFGMAYFIFTVPIVTFALHRGILKNENYQVEHQKFMKRIYTGSFFSYQEVFEGPTDRKTLSINIPHNLWMQYTLEGDYQKEVEAIELKRKFVTRKKFGVYEQIVQRGWELVFTFGNPPQSGRCIVEHT